jgi:hypothetical protein
MHQYDTMSCLHLGTPLRINFNCTNLILATFTRAYTSPITSSRFTVRLKSFVPTCVRTMSGLPRSLFPRLSSVRQSRFLQCTVHSYVQISRSVLMSSSILSTAPQSCLRTVSHLPTSHLAITAPYCSSSPLVFRF